jgi:cell pole-organizing protein PopZ
MGKSAGPVAAQAEISSPDRDTEVDDHAAKETSTELEKPADTTHAPSTAAPASPRYGPMASGLSAEHVAGRPVHEPASSEKTAASPDPVSAAELPPAAARTTDVPSEDAGSDAEAGAFREALVAPSTQTAVGGSLDRLKKSAMGDIDARVEAILRPMLREWLDDNLPQLVESIVRDEIERIARES